MSQPRSRSRSPAHPLLVPIVSLTLASLAGTAGPLDGQQPASPGPEAAAADETNEPAFRRPSASGGSAVDDAAPAPLSPRLLSDMRFRSIGPALTGGRIHDVEALPHDPSTVWVATASGGLWKTTNGGTTWTPVFDDQPVSTFGDVAVAPSAPDVVWAGTGEQQNRQSTSWGNGVYRSTDGGESWTHLGLEATRHVAKVIVHPRDPDVAWVAALGNLWRGSSERGVYRTTDGGETWEKVLAGENPWTGAIDLEMDPRNPDVLYAALYQRLRRTWGFNGGGPGSGIWKSTDGGNSWRELENGLPSGEKGRIGLAVSPADPDRIYATVQHADGGGTYRSDDGGESWTHVNDLNPRPMYYSHVFADPRDPDRVYVLATEAYTSGDGGHTFTRLPTRPTYDVGVHSDHHTMWIAPEDPEHFYLAGDAGLHVTRDRGRTYRRINNLPIGQFYAIGLDRRDPYRIYGGMQDNHSWMGPSATRRWTGITPGDWRQVGFGDGMYQQPDPTSHRYVYVGAQNGDLTRVDAETGDRLTITPRPPVPLLGSPGDSVRDEDFRFDWVTPTLVSRHVPSTVYLGGNRLFVSRDRGDSWSATEDLTRDIDRDTLTLMGVEGSNELLSENDGTASFSEITTIDESPLDPGVLWVGTDDGRVQLSRDGGRSWTAVGRALREGPVAVTGSGRAGSVGDGARGTGRDPSAPPRTAYVSRVTASAAGPGVAYVALDAHRRGDFSTYLYRTDDFGRSWTRIDDGLPAGAGPVNDVIEHPDRPGLLFAGTEHGLFVSPDAGRSWTAIGTNLPTTLYDDLALHPEERDLVVGTHGRSLWILDDTDPLAAWTRETAGVPVHLFRPRPTTLFHPWKSTSYRGQAAYAGENPSFGALLTYHLAEDVDSARIVVRDAVGRRVRELSVPTTGGVLHRVTWDLRHPPPPAEDDDGEGGGAGTQDVGEVVEPDTVLPAPARPLESAGPLVSPGVYTVTLVADGRRSSRELRVRADPEMPTTNDQWHEREAFLVDLLDLQERAVRVAERAAALHDSLAGRADSMAVLEARTVAERLDDVRDDLYGLASSFNRAGVTQGTVYPPTTTQRRQKERLARKLEAAAAELETLESR